MMFGAIHDPGHPGLDAAIDYATLSVGGAALEANWFTKWHWPALGDALGNGIYGNCCEVADLLLVEGWRLSLGLPALSIRVLTELALLRYQAVGAWDGVTAPGPGTITQADCFAWQVAPIVAGDRSWRVRWATVPLNRIFSALLRAPLLLTLGLTAPDKDDADLWVQTPSGPFVVLHRVVCGASRSGKLVCRTWGYDRLVDPSRVVAADLMIPTDLPSELKTAGLDWSVLA